MIKVKLAACAAVAMLSTGMVSAEGEAGSGPNPFVDCGIGGALFPNTAWAAVSSNTIWDVGSTALTSATASPETCNGKDVEAAAFILDTYDSLAEETAQGSGDHITAMLNILEVDSADHGKAISSIRAGMASVVADGSYDQLDRVGKATVYYNLVNQSISNT